MNSLVSDLWAKKIYDVLTGPTLEQRLKDNPAKALAQELPVGLGVKDDGKTLRIVKVNRRNYGLFSDRTINTHNT